MKSKRDIVIYFSLLYNGDWDKVYLAICKKEEIDWEYFEKIPARFKENCITIFDEDYPSRLAKTYHPPLVLFYKGNRELIKDESKFVAVIGTRSPSDYGAEAVNMVVDALEEDYIVVSGMARGVDGLAHRRAIENNGKTIAVIAGGIDEIYPPENEDIYYTMCKNHLVLSEHPFPGMKKDYFPIRNRIIVGLSKAVIVPEAYFNSGSMTSVHLALSMGRDVLCIPHPFNSNTANNTLIAEGAFLINDKRDIVEILSGIKTAR